MPVDHGAWRCNGDGGGRSAPRCPCLPPLPRSWSTCSSMSPSTDVACAGARGVRPQVSGMGGLPTHIPTRLPDLPLRPRSTYNAHVHVEPPRCSHSCMRPHVPSGASSHHTIKEYHHADGLCARSSVVCAASHHLPLSTTAVAWRMARPRPILLEKLMMRSSPMRHYSTSCFLSFRTLHKAIATSL